MAAPLGFKTFTTGDVLTAADTNGYLMQGVWTFADSAARSAAVTSPQEGNVSFLKDTNSLEIYDGAAWVAYGSGDITGVTAGTGISGGGTSGTVTVTNSMATAIDAKGDLIAGTGADAFSRLAVGTNNQVLTADSSTATGLKWASASAATQNYSLVTSASNPTGTSTVTLSGLSGYNSLVLYYYDIYINATNGNVRIRFNNDSGSNYEYWYFTSFGSSNSQSTSTAGTAFNGQYTSTANSAISGYMQIQGANNTGKKLVMFPNLGHGSSTYTQNQNGVWNNTALITSIDISSIGGNFNGGSGQFRVYGSTV